MSRYTDDNERMASFGMDADFEGGKWINGEFYYEKKRERRKLTKDDHIYGVFNDEEYDSDKDVIRQSKKAKRFAQPLSFVSSSEKLNEKVQEEEEEEDKEEEDEMEEASESDSDAEDDKDEDAEEEEEEEEEDVYAKLIRKNAARGGMGGLGLGATASSSSSDADSTAAGEKSKKKKKKQTKKKKVSFATDDQKQQQIPKRTFTIIQPKKAKKSGSDEESGQRGDSDSDSGAESSLRESSFREANESRDRDFGKWLDQKAGKNVLKMMRNMGYQIGKGLGKEGQGIVNPIKVKVFKKGETIKTTSDYGSSASDVEERAPQKKKAPKRVKTQGWKKTKKTKAKKPSFPSVEELLRQHQQQLKLERGEDAGSVSPTASPTATAAPSTTVGGLKIMDMTGAQPRVFTNFDELKKAKKSKAAEEDEAPQVISNVVPELQFNVRMLVDLARADIRDIDSRAQMARDRIKEITNEKERVLKRISLQSKYIESLQEILEIISRCFAKVNDPEKPMPLSTLLDVFDVLKHKYAEEFDMYNLAKFAVLIAAPLFKKHFETWSPLQQPTFGVELVRVWRNLLHPSKAATASTTKKSSAAAAAAQQSAEAYTKLLWDVIVPKIRAAITTEWEVRSPENAVRLLESWLPLSPQPVMHHLIDQLLVPRIMTEVNTHWNPRRDTVPIHQWIHPWLGLGLASSANETTTAAQISEIINTRLESHGIFNTIRYRISEVLADWHPSDASAHAMLYPWKTVFDIQSMHQLLARYIVPKLVMALRTASDYLYWTPDGNVSFNADSLRWLLAWEDMIPTNQLLLMLETEFFPKWMQVLYHWLADNPNFEHVLIWYTNWKQVFPESLVNNERVTAQFNRALDMLNHALMGGPIGEFPATQIPQQQSAAAAASQTAAKPTTAHADISAVDLDDMKDMKMKDIIERYAEENDIMFVPKGRTAEGKQLYTFNNNTTLYIDNDMIYVKPTASAHWKPVLLSELIEISQQKKAKGSSTQQQRR